MAEAIILYVRNLALYLQYALQLVLTPKSEHRQSEDLLTVAIDATSTPYEIEI